MMMSYTKKSSPEKLYEYQWNDTGHLHHNFITFQYTMSQEIENVIVERISLVSSEATPAVPKAETRFALFKAIPKRITKLQRVFEKEEEYKIRKLVELLEKNQNNIH
jgi:hypothetical protein